MKDTVEVKLHSPKLPEAAAYGNIRAASSGAMGFPFVKIPTFCFPGSQCLESIGPNMNFVFRCPIENDSIIECCLEDIIFPQLILSKLL